MLNDAAVELLAQSNVDVRTLSFELCRPIPETAPTLRRQIMDELNLHTIAELTKYAVRAGLRPIDFNALTEVVQRALFRVADQPISREASRGPRYR